MAAEDTDVPDIPVPALRSLIASHRNLDSATSSRVTSIIRKKRPSIPVKQGLIDSADLSAFNSEFSEVEEASRHIVKKYSASVGRIEVQDINNNFLSVGTGFLVSVGECVRMATAGHLLKVLLRPGNSIRQSRPPMQGLQQNQIHAARVNFHDTGDVAPTHIYEIKKWVWAHPRWDLLLFDLDTTPEEFTERDPLPLEKDAQWWPELQENPICVLGYPISRTDELDRAFNNTFDGKLGIKRLSLGLCPKPSSDTLPPPEEVEDVSTITRDRSTIDHDASTLQGSSGSPIFSLHSKKVIGLHYDGGEIHRSGNRPPPDPNNAVNIPVALLERDLLTEMEGSAADTEDQPPINWDPDVPMWTGSGRLEKNDSKNFSAIQTSNNPVLQSVVADRPDFRDRIYRSSLLKANDELKPSNKGSRFIRDQANVPACTAFAVAAAINVQLEELGRTNEPVSEQMLYSMATLHDEWIDDSKGGSSLRGAIKGFYQNGVCLDKDAPLSEGGLNWSLSRTAALKARSITLGAYYRLRPNLLDFHLALNETGAIVVSADIHKGWRSKKGLKQGKISPGGKRIGTHAFAILGYTQDGFIIQNSWGENWCTWNGHPGLAHWHYDDWADNLIDAWVLRLAPSTPAAFDLVPKIAGQHLLLQSDESEKIQLPSLPRPRRFSLIGHVCQIERDRFICDGRLGMGLDSLRETALFLRTDAAKEKYPNVAFFFHDPLLEQDNISKLCAWMIKPFKRHGVYPIHIVYGIDEAYTIKLRVMHECAEIKSRFGAAEQDLSFYIERRISQLMQPLIKVFREGIDNAVLPGNPLWQVLASIFLEMDKDCQISVFASGVGFSLVEQLSKLVGSSSSDLQYKSTNENTALFEHKLSNLFLLAPSATIKMINALDIADATSVCTLANEPEPSMQLRGYVGDWIDLTARVSKLDSYGSPATRDTKATREQGYDQALSNTLVEASTEADVMNKCLKMFSNKKYSKKNGFN